MTGIVIKNENGYFLVQTKPNEIFQCKVRGRLKKERYSLLVGDYVLITPINEREGHIEEILPRKNSLKRPYVANIDQVVLVVAAHNPDINALLLDKLLVMIAHANIPVILCVNKWDLADDTTEQLVKIYENIGYKVVKTSSYDANSVRALNQLLDGKITAFAGPSGVGKSSLLNVMYPDFQLQTGSVSEKIKRGRHTTRHASLHALRDNTYLMDTPGFSAISFDHISKEELALCFPEFTSYEEACKFQPCSHTHEPICGVKEAIANQDIADSRYTSYINILEEILHGKK